MGRTSCWSLWSAVILLAVAEISVAQPREPIARLVIDVRAASAGLPAVEGWTPTVPADAQVPARGLGLDVGAHVYPLRVRSFALGIGATFLAARGKASPPLEEPASLTPPLPEVTTKLSSVAPQVSLNFGHSLGWSYLSVGLGRTRVESEAFSQRGNLVLLTTRDSDWTKTLNYGGGARWFIKSHLGVGFDIRWHKLSVVASTATHPGAPRASLLTAGVGIVLK